MGGLYPFLNGRVNNRQAISHKASRRLMGGFFMNEVIMKELQEVEKMVKEAQTHEKYTEKYFIIREGMLKLAGGFAQAALLSSLLGWTRHWLKTDNEVYKQIKEAAEAGNIEKIRKLKEQIRQGWFWKSYREMSEELLGEVSVKTCQRYIEKFEEKGFISSRDPKEKATYRARWYKANIDKIKEALEEMGYQLDYYKDQKEGGICQNDKSLNQGVSGSEMAKPLISGICQNDKSPNQEVSAPETAKPAPLSICQNDKPSGQNDKSSGQNDKHLLYTSFNKPSFNPEGDDDAPVTHDQEDWKTDIDFLSFKKRFTDAGADDIILEKKNEDAYKQFKEILREHDFTTLLEMAKKYIDETGKDAQILYFLGGRYKHYLAKKLVRTSKRPTLRTKNGKMPQSIQMQIEQDLFYANLTLENESEDDVEKEKEMSPSADLENRLSSKRVELSKYQKALNKEREKSMPNWSVMGSYERTIRTLETEIKQLESELQQLQMA
jgi:hypothetical protein